MLNIIYFKLTYISYKRQFKVNSIYLVGLALKELSETWLIKYIKYYIL